MTFGASQGSGEQAASPAQKRSATRSRSRSRRSRTASSSRSRSRSVSEDRCEPRKDRKRSYRHSVEQKLDSLTDVLMAVQRVLLNQSHEGAQGKGAFDSAATNPQEGQPSVGENEVVIAGESETTIYKNAVDYPEAVTRSPMGLGLTVEQIGDNKHVSSSSDDAIDTSDDLIDHENLVVGIAGQGNTSTGGNADVQPGTSGGVMHTVERAVNNNAGMTIAERMLKEADTSRGRLMPTKGECSVELNNFLHSAYVDEEYLVVGSHVEESIYNKIVNNAYVDFTRLLPRDWAGAEEDQCMELVNRNGLSYWTPMVNRDLGVISSYSKWEVAFRVFANIYMTKFPQKASELIQYSHVIHTASLTYTWENVYYYDREFRIHMSRHPQRSWAVILQQAWNLRLKDRLKFENFGDRGKAHHKSKEICKRYNRGKCHSGSACRYEHRCLNCGKFGHGEHICRKKLENLHLSPVRPAGDKPVHEASRGGATGAK